MFCECTFAERLSLLRKKKKITLLQLADVLSITKSAVGNLEHGRKKPSIDIACALADYFDVSLDYLVGRSDEPKRR